MSTSEVAFNTIALMVSVLIIDTSATSTYLSHCKTCLIMLTSLPSSDVSAMSLPEGERASSENKGNEINGGALHYNVIIMHGLSMLTCRDIHLWVKPHSYRTESWV